MSLVEKSKINNFLSRMREVIGKINGFHFVDREKNLNSLYKHGLTIDIAKFYIETLEVKDYWKGPEPDDKEFNNYDWWFFAREINTALGNILFYIKIRIETRGREQVICLSFHEADYPIDFPYK
ncbi:hypothetical protein [Halanaerobium congolense]|jgi:hypothetical protein|uniref:MqsR (Motility quorum-sensing regulator) toxin of toxin-antitoxin system n=1 Tax=Halanaerobium congolense TaxID=54121 RepID=A0A1G6NG53_9FIRM|nr:hypothetical protein [Halanaerobium congolense]TDS32259.1 hypothetical protein BY453_10852 [Halanaerobium congolense]SDC66802.1 hypothetical protein SAMN04488597_11167 [Halanaerobium congolense]